MLQTRMIMRVRMREEMTKRVIFCRKENDGRGRLVKALKRGNIIEWYVSAMRWRIPN